MNPYQNSFGGNIPQDVAGKQGENVIFIVYTLKDTPETLDKVKDVCANFSGMIRSMRNRFPELIFWSARWDTLRHLLKESYFTIVFIRKV